MQVTSIVSISRNIFNYLYDNILITILNVLSTKLFSNLSMSLILSFSLENEDRHFISRVYGFLVPFVF